MHRNYCTLVLANLLTLVNSIRSVTVLHRHWIIGPRDCGVAVFVQACNGSADLAAGVEAYLACRSPVKLAEEVGSTGGRLSVTLDG